MLLFYVTLSNIKDNEGNEGNMKKIMKTRKGNMKTRKGNHKDT